MEFQHTREPTSRIRYRKCIDRRRPVTAKEAMEDSCHTPNWPPRGLARVTTLNYAAEARLDSRRAIESEPESANHAARLQPAEFAAELVIDYELVGLMEQIHVHMVAIQEPQ